jgi:hypothetical protein
MVGEIVEGILVAIAVLAVMDVIVEFIAGLF